MTRSSVIEERISTIRFIISGEAGKVVEVAERVSNRLREALPLLNLSSSPTQAGIEVRGHWDGFLKGDNLPFNVVLKRALCQVVHGLRPPTGVQIRPLDRGGEVIDLRRHEKPPGKRKGRQAGAGRPRKLAKLSTASTGILAKRSSRRNVGGDFR